MNSRMKGDFHVRFCGNVGVKFLCVTRLSASGRQRSGQRSRKLKLNEMLINKKFKMKMLSKLASLILLLCLNQTIVLGTTIQPVERTVGKLKISIDPRMEVLTTVHLLSNYTRVNRSSPYSKDVLNYFKPFSSHEAALMTDSLMQKYGFANDAPITFMLHLSQPPALDAQIQFPDYLLGRSGRGDNLEQYRKSIKQFAEKSDFETFWNSKIGFYNQILDLTIAEMGERNMIKVLEDYFNETNENYNIIIMPLYSGGAGPRITDTDGKDMIYSCIGPTNMKDDIPYLNEEYLLYLVWHEFGHSFVNPVTAKYSDRLVSDTLFEPIKNYMSRQGYNYWEICVNEHIIRAIHVRLYELHLGSQQSKVLLESELKQGFIYIEPLIEKLKEFENQRDKDNIAFSEFFPELLNMFDSLQKVEYWKKFNLNFAGPIFAPLTEEKVAVIYPTHDLDTDALDIAQNHASQFFDFFTQYKRSMILLADTTALVTDLSEYGIITYGTIESNLFLKRYAHTFPFRIENQTIYANKEYTDTNIKFITCVPNPYNPTKGMSIHTALSNREIQGFNEAYFSTDGQFLGIDYILFLNRETIINKGFYDKGEKWTF